MIGAASTTRFLLTPTKSYDPLHPYSRQQGSERGARPYRFARDPSNLDGPGPSLYYGRAAAVFSRPPAGKGTKCQCLLERRRLSTGWQLHRARWRSGGGGGMGGGMGWVEWAAAWAAEWVAWAAWA